MKEIYIGLDLCKSNVQISYYREDKKEPESIYQLNNTETYLLPNVMFYSETGKKWYVGNQVSSVRFKEEGVMVEDIIEHIDSLEHVIAGGVPYTYDTLLFTLLKTHIEELLARFEESVLKGITFTIEEYHPKVYQTLLRIREEWGLTKEHFYVMSHENAFFQFVMNQDEKLSNNSVAMFEYGKEGMEYFRIDRKHQGSTRIFNLSRQDMKQELPYTKLFEDIEKLDREFAEVARKKMKETYISAVYLTGAGFNDTWISKAKAVLCDGGRRAFMGQNIFTKGACYHARFGAYEEGRDCVLLTEGSIPFDIGVNVGEKQGPNHFQPIAIGGREWYNMKGKVTLFLDGTDSIDLLYRDKVSKDLQREVIKITGLPKRPPKTTKISLEIELFDEKQGAIVIRDMGFGKIYPTTNKIFRKEFVVG